MLLMIDNYDSFTYNLVQYFGELGQDVRVIRNDEHSVAEIAEWQPDYLVVSPGPCNPDKAGISIEAIEYFSGKVPVFGVCLGHQSIGAAFGGTVCHAQTLMHGKLSQIHHRGESIMTGLAQPFTATRYHSLVVSSEGFPKALSAIAHTDDGEIMALRHREHPTVGVQFHPESISTDHGHQILQNFLDLK